MPALRQTVDSRTPLAYALFVVPKTPQPGTSNDPRPRMLPRLLPVALAAILLGAFGAPGEPSPGPAPGAAPPDTATAPRPGASEAAPNDPAPATVLPRQGHVAILPVEGMIYDFTLKSLERRAERAMDGGASLLVFELDTPGGVLNDALDISYFIRNLPVPTIAWIRGRAYSAGILVASAADFIVMSPGAATGDCAPIVPGRELAATERAKALSPLLAEFRANASANGYDPALFHAMCVLGTEVYLVEHPETGQRKHVNQADYQWMVEGREPEAVTRGFLQRLFGGRALPADVAPEDVGAVTREVSGPQDRGTWRPVESLPGGFTFPGGRVHDGKTLLTLDNARAEAIGLSARTLRDEQAITQWLRAARVDRVPQTWSENLAGWLAHPAVRGVLVVVLLLGAYLEFQSPGLGLPGAASGLALILLLGSPLFIGLSEVWHLLLFFFGFLLLVADLVTGAGFGLLAGLGILLMFVGLVLGAVPTSGGGLMPMPAPEAWYRLQHSLLWSFFGLLGSCIGGFYFTRHFQQIPFARRLVLAGPAGPPPERPGQHVSGEEAIGTPEAGALGRVATDLRPAGQAEFDGELIDCLTRGEWIERGTPVRIVERAGNRILVEKATEARA